MTSFIDLISQAGSISVVSFSFVSFDLNSGNMQNGQTHFKNLAANVAPFWVTIMTILI